MHETIYSIDIQSIYNDFYCNNYKFCEFWFNDATKPIWSCVLVR